MHWHTRTKNSLDVPINLTFIVLDWDETLVPREDPHMHREVTKLFSETPMAGIKTLNFCVENQQC